MPAERYLSTSEAVKWLARNARFDNKDLIVNRAFLRKLNETCRLTPDKTSLFGGNKYALSHLRQYVHDVKPR